MVTFQLGSGPVSNFGRPNLGREPCGWSLSSRLSMRDDVAGDGPQSLGCMAPKRPSCVNGLCVRSRRTRGRYSAVISIFYDLSNVV